MRVTLERLQELLHYNPETGEFRWKADRVNWVKAGDVAGGKTTRGYLLIGIDGAVYYAHRLAWFYVHGRWPHIQIDHVNLVRHDNRLINLREATLAQNRMNCRAFKNNKSRFKGVSFDPRNGVWQARITQAGRTRSLGNYKTAVVAHAAYCVAARELRGDFARTE